MMAQALDTRLQGEMLTDEPMSRHTSWRVGGPARRFYRPADSEDLVRFLAGLEPGEPLLWLGLGSNLLVRDGGFPGTVVSTHGCLDRLEQIDPTAFRAEAGVSCARVARATVKSELTGLEFFAGIPGTVGGALAMNAGAWGGETWTNVEAVETVDRFGEIRRREPGEFSVAYRQVTGAPGEWFLAGSFRLEPGDRERSQARIRELLERRAMAQPTRQPSGGSVFRNPPSGHAARLIEQTGLKGMRVGGAEVSTKHANFIVNLGSATAADIEALIFEVKARVRDATGIDLQTEVHIVGQPS